MMNEIRLIGAISIYRQEARPLCQRQIKLVGNFASQAGIENTNPRQRLREASEPQRSSAMMTVVVGWRLCTNGKRQKRYRRSNWGQVTRLDAGLDLECVTDEGYGFGVGWTCHLISTTA
jgi:hypothetical protein